MVASPLKLSATAPAYELPPPLLEQDGVRVKLPAGLTWDKLAAMGPAPYYTDNLMHNLKTERFYKPLMINGRLASADGPIKDFSPARH